MKSLQVTFWAESLKVRKSKVFWISIGFFVFVAFMMGLIMFIQKHPEVSQKLGTGLARIARQMSRPFIRGSIKSRMIRSGF